MTYSFEAEQAVIGAILLDPKLIERCINVISPKDFYVQMHKSIFEEMLLKFRNDQKIDYVTILASFGNDKNVKNYMLDMVQMVPALGNFQEYVKIVAEKSKLRELLNVSSMIRKEVEKSTDSSVIKEYIKNQIIPNVDPNGHKYFIECFYDTLEYMSKPIQKQKVLTGIQEIDDYTNGLTKGNLIILAARPGMGKTSFALRIARNVSETKKVIFFSLEMTVRELSVKLVAMETGIPLKSLNKGEISDDIWKKIITSFKNIKNVGANLIIDDTPASTIERIKSKIIEIGDADLIIIDYLHLIRMENSTGNDFFDLTIISRELKNLAKEFDVPVICLSQLSRACEQRADHRPTLSDLRGSGSIEQDADIVFMLYRSDYYITREEFMNGKEYTNSCECIIAKNRHGSTGTVIMHWDPNNTNFKA